ncbi:pyrroline-5-carboxylate reductase [Domibacillus enclensis]|uniref:Pyrroline-5-carboxylate reductase n=1 Tax=Domibacillus enclensis TaxID=1017273 RepID=A0A1N6PEJ6_9BACI|nr:pyrroline-5-carboxylate reductase [Domibacillus enclensis]OXS80336.1 pyrroline-5-carboxylate reductase [Domibacillus enclensis]SIQ02714.1 pyrroline-5-carboxylate reductase [Domibacillus enclensis]
MKAVFIGAGSMAEAIIAGSLRSGALSADHTYVTNKTNDARLRQLAEDFGVQAGYEAETALLHADLIILAMKPKDVEAGLETIRSSIPDEAVVISLLAGVSIEFMEDVIGKPCAIIRSMPNTSAAVGKSATAISLNRFVTEKQHKAAVDLFSAIGTAITVEESQMDAVTALSGSGPAYFYYVAEAMQQAGEELGLDPETAKELLIQTLLGAASMLSKHDGQAEALRKAITSPGGTTEAAVRTFDEFRVKQAISAGVKEAAVQSKRLGNAYSR